jgi:hypothetical protein
MSGYLLKDKKEIIFLPETRDTWAMNSGILL